MRAPTGAAGAGRRGAWPHVGAPVPRSAPSMPALFCGPVPGPVPGVRASRWISGRLKARSGWRGWGAMCWFPSSRWAHDQPRGDCARGSTRHRRRGLVGARDRAALTALGAQECPITSHQPLPGRHRRRTGQLPPRHPRLPHPTRGIHPTHCHHPLTPPSTHTQL